MKQSINCNSSWLFKKHQYKALGQLNEIHKSKYSQFKNNTICGLTRLDNQNKYREERAEKLCIHVAAIYVHQLEQHQDLEAHYRANIEAILRSELQDRIQAEFFANEQRRERRQRQRRERSRQIFVERGKSKCCKCCVVM